MVVSTRYYVDVRGKSRMQDAGCRNRTSSVAVYGMERALD
jgi:hypothetical protein